MLLAQIKFDSVLNIIYTVCLMHSLIAVSGSVGGGRKGSQVQFFLESSGGIIASSLLELHLYMINFRYIVR